MPIYRLVLHYQFGLPQLGYHRTVAILMDFLDRVAALLVPRSFWAYLVIRASGDHREGDADARVRAQTGMTA